MAVILFDFDATRCSCPLVSYFVGQGVGLIDSVKSAGAVVQEFKGDFADAIEHMNSLVAE